MAHRIEFAALPRIRNRLAAAPGDLVGPDPELLFLLPSWEAAWLPRPTEGVADHAQAFIIDIAALGHALHAVIRPAALLPDSAPSLDPFALALRKIEFESGRLMQAQIMFLKSADLQPHRSAVNTAV